jgi:hypothetical protein
MYILKFSIFCVHWHVFGEELLCNHESNRRIATTIFLLIEQRDINKKIWNKVAYEKKNIFFS